MTIRWEGEQQDADDAARAEQERLRLLEHAQGETIVLGNEFSEIRITKVGTRNGARLLVEAPRSGQWVALCPLELEALTWQRPATFSAMIGNPFASLVEDDE
ncbi:hypothetical protein E1293_18870 [Actinomadura darangshiensis]|uniref:Dihydrodiol dehydrogenase n=1 Tax=Actinomadura darangshiensis TaxID=705336 RepID=A0A4R5B7J2_9ACTN|nr:hypothetical protein [Actinomadura darangshiensis]TDD81335.1 hypothetical protein E1293_18870 [Actinomadura darangshiensis]